MRASSSGVSGVTCSRTVARAISCPTSMAALKECESTSATEARVMLSNPARESAVSVSVPKPSRPRGTDTSIGGGNGRVGEPVAATTAAAAAAATLEADPAPAAAAVVEDAPLGFGRGMSSTNPPAPAAPPCLSRIPARVRLLAKAALTNPSARVLLTQRSAVYGSSFASSGSGAVHEKWRAWSAGSGSGAARVCSRRSSRASAAARTGAQSISTICVSSFVMIDERICEKEGRVGGAGWARLGRVRRGRRDGSRDGARAGFGSGAPARRASPRWLRRL
jgi:hypothetical protein